MDRDYFVHDSSYIDENVNIGEGTKIWHFSHIQSGAVIGANCTMGQNVNVANNVIIGLIRFPPSNAYFRGSQNSDSEYNSNSLSNAESIFSIYLL